MPALFLGCLSASSLGYDSVGTKTADSDMLERPSITGDMSPFRKTVIEVLDEVFLGRPYDLRLLEHHEFERLSELLSEFASRYEAPVRGPGTTRYYGGGTAWNSSNTPDPKIWFGSRADGLYYGPDVKAVQTLCLMHDSVVCHDAVTDMLGRHRTEFLPSHFSSRVRQGECIVDEELLGTRPVSTEVIEFAADRLNATLQVYDKARQLIQRGYLIPVPTRVLIRKNKAQLMTQVRHGLHDPKLLRFAKEANTIAVGDGAVNVFLYATGPATISAGPFFEHPDLRLHYGLLHHLKCLLVAFETRADFMPSDEFGWRSLDYKYEELIAHLGTKSRFNLKKMAASSLLAIPIVRGFEIDDIVSIRRDEEVFEELRRILGSATEPEIGGRSMSEFVKDFEAEAADALERWRGTISASPGRRRLFRDIAMVGGNSTAVIGCGVAIFLGQEPVSALISAAAGLPGLYLGLTDLLVAGNDPKKRLFKVLRKYKLPPESC